MALSHQPHFEKSFRVPVALANDKLRYALNKMSDTEGEEALVEKLRKGAEGEEGGLPIPHPTQQAELWRKAAGLRPGAPIPGMDPNSFVPGL